MHAFDAVVEDLRAFVAEREWEPFHTPKDLAVGLNVEAGELLEVFQWRDPSPGDLAADPRDLERVRHETADVFLYAVLMAERVGFDLLEACREKLAHNREKYPVERSRGRATKYTDLEGE